jgi:hypothetical protein
MSGYSGSASGLDVQSTPSNPIPSLICFGFFDSSNASGQGMPYNIATVNPRPGEPD